MTIKKAITMAKQGNAVEFESAITSELGLRVSGALDAMKQELAQNMLSQDGEDSNDEEV